MREQPRLDEANIVRIIETAYGVRVAELAFLPIGADASSAVYRVDAKAGTRLLVKGRRSTDFKPASLIVPRWLWSAGVPHVLPPLVTADDALWMTDGQWTWSAFPFLDVHTAAETALTGGEWSRLGVTLRQIHALQLDDGTQRLVPIETYVPSRFGQISRLRAGIPEGSTDPLVNRFGSFWSERQAEISELVQRCESLSQELRDKALPQVLCHADFHVWNILIDAKHGLWVVDWDETTMAPKERDLMFVEGGIVRDLLNEEQTASFFSGYGSRDLDQHALAYYRCAWALQDLEAYGEDILHAPHLGEEARRASFKAVRGLFQPDGIVGIALDV